MQEFLDALTANQTAPGMPSVWHLTISLVLSFLLALVIGKVYQVTHKGISYSQSNVHTYVLMCVVVSVIMLIIGSNIARAFSLVGALSIVRFRNAVKESRDVGFVFWAMAVGMACGTYFYAQAILSTIMIAVFVFVMYYFNMFARTVRERILLVEVDSSVDHDQILGEFFGRTFQDYHLISMETMPHADTVQLVYSVTVPGKFASGPFLEEVRRLNGQKKVSLIEGQQQMDL